MTLSPDPKTTRTAAARPQARALEVSDLAKRYPTGVEALRAVSLGIDTGEFFGLPRPQRRRQVDADPLRNGSRPADRGRDQDLRPRRDHELRRGAARRRARTPGD